MELAQIIVPLVLLLGLVTAAIRLGRTRRRVMSYHHIETPTTFETTHGGGSGA